jgi:hypothetical protein
MKRLLRGRVGYSMLGLLYYIVLRVFRTRRMALLNITYSL